ncbi:MAG: glycosyltransferase family 39 protein [bacterium]|nr:glycosyltransferase family 39 protein [bacterium]
MKKILFCAILVLGITLRFYQLGVVPASMDWDEVSLGYNAYSLLLNGTDEYGNSWPLSIRSFNDYKPPAYTYLDIIPTAIFGLNEFGTRFPAAFFGSLTVIGVYFLTREFFKNSTFNQQISLFAMLIFAISPWHLQFSRAAFEGGIAVFLVVWGMYFLLKWLNDNSKYAVILSSILLAASFYAYHAPRMIVPLLLLGIALRYRKHFWSRKNELVIPAVLGVLLLLPLGLVLLRGSASERFSSVSVFSPKTEILRPLEYEREDKAVNNWNSWIHNRRIEYGKEFISGYLNHFNVTKMFMKGDAVERHHAPDVGLFYFIELPFILLGILSLIKRKFKYKFIFFYWALIAPLPAAISTGTPHAIRSILLLPLPQIAIAVGFVEAWIFLKNISLPDKKLILQTSTGIIILLFGYNFAYYLNQYYHHMDVEYAQYWQYGYKQLVQKLAPLENQYDKIVITPAFDQPYIYFLYYKQYDPRIWINNGEFNRGFDKYEFRTPYWAEDRKLHNTLLVGEMMGIPEGEPGTIDIIRLPEGKDGSKDVFRIIPSQY